MATIFVDAFCAGCGKYLGQRKAETPCPPAIKGCCEVCFPQPQKPVAAPKPVVAKLPPPKVEAPVLPPAPHEVAAQQKAIYQIGATMKSAKPAVHPPEPEDPRSKDQIKADDAEQCEKNIAQARQDQKREDEAEHAGGEAAQ